MNLIELLTEGKVTEFNNQRGTLRRPPDLFGADLPDLKLPEVDFSGANLQKADLSGTDLTHAILARADLSGADLTGAVLHGVMAVGSKWRDAYLGDVDLAEADLTGSDFSGAEMEGCRAPGALLNGAKLNNAVMPGIDFEGADLREARFASADLTGAKLTGANLREAQLNGAKLAGAHLPGVDLTRAKLAGADLKGADLTGATLHSVDLTGAQLAGAKLAGASLRRADLTGVDLTLVDLEGVDLTEAQFEGDAAPATPLKTEKVPLLVDDPELSGNKTGLAMMWENQEAGGTTRLRVAVGKLGGKFDGSSYALPLPADLVLARALLARPSGYLALALVERPGGMFATATEIADNGAPLSSHTMRMPYRPAVRPVLRMDGDDTLLFGIGRDGPGLLVHKLTPEGLEQVHASAMPTARGFVGSNDPIVLSKGGVVLRLERNGPGTPMRAPATFPGRTCAACLVGDGVALAWTTNNEPGFRFALLRPGENPDEHRLLPKTVIGALDVAPAGDGSAWVVYTVEAAGAGDATHAHAMRLPQGDKVDIVTDGDVDLTQVKFVAGSEPLAGLVTLDEDVLVYALTTSGAKLRWRTG